MAPAHVIVRIRDVPHLILRRSDLSAIESWKMTDGTVERYYFIQFTMRDGKVTCDYTDEALWTEILAKLGTSKLFDNMQGEPSR